MPITIIIILGFQSSPYPTTKHGPKRPKYKGLFSMAIGNGIPCTRCVSHTVYLAHGNSNGEARG